MEASTPWEGRGGGGDTKISRATKIQRKETEQDQVKALVTRKGVFSTLSVYTNVGTMCITSNVVLKAQRI